MTTGDLAVAPSPAAERLRQARRWRLDSASLTGAAVIDWQRHVLPNGLTVILQPDTSTALVHVSIGYRVGSMEEGPGQTGLAHFLEHMMFGGTRALPGEYVARLTDAGATMVNAMTMRDMTRYLQTVPAHLLDFVLYAEADRMAHFATNLDPEIVERERRVVQEEKRQHQSAPLGRIFEWLSEGMLPYGHPYSHPVIGYAQDIAGYTLDAIRDWHATHYGAENAAIVVAGAIDPDRTLVLVERYFGSIAPTTPAPRILSRVEPMPRQSMLRVADRIGQPGHFYQAWTAPSVVASPREHVALAVAARLLGQGQSSLLHRRLVSDDAVASSVGAEAIAGRGTGMVVLSAHLNQAPDAGIGNAMDDVVGALAASPVSPERLEDMRVRMLADHVRALESFERRAGILLEGELLHGDAGWFGREARLIGDIGGAEIADAVRRWLSADPFRLLVDQVRPGIAQPQEPVAAPVIGDAGAVVVNAPRWEEARLRSGARLRLSRRPGDPVFHLRAIGRGGRAQEPIGLEGIAEMAASLTSIGAGDDDAAALAERSDRAGLKIAMRAGLDNSLLNIGGLADALPSAMAMAADLLLRPRFGSDDQAQVLASLGANARARAGTPDAMAFAAVNAAMLGGRHRLAMPLPAVPDIAQRLHPGELRRFHDAAWRPRDTLLLLAADLDLAEAVELAETMFEGWQDAGIPPAEARLDLDPVAGGIRLIDAPGRQSVRISINWRVDGPLDQEALIQHHVFGHTLAGDFNARCGMRLRQELGWTYGVQGGAGEVLPRRGPGYGAIVTEVKPEVCGAALAELRSLIAALRDGSPVTEGEIEKYRRSERQRLARLNEKAGDAVEAMQAAFEYGYGGAGDWEAYRARVEALEPGLLEINATTLLPADDALICVMMGDRALMTASLERAGLAAALPVAGDLR